MPQTRQRTAEELAAELHETERAVEVAFQKVLTISARFPEYRRAARLSHTIGQGVYVAGLKAHTAAVALKGAMTEMHGELDNLRATLKLAPVVAGVGEDKPPHDPNAVPAWPMEPIGELLP